MTATTIPPTEPNPFTEGIPLTRAHQALRLIMVGVLEETFPDHVRTMPIVVVDKDGNWLKAWRPPLELIPSPKSDSELASEFLDQLAELPEFNGKIAALGFIRFDVSPPEIIISDIRNRQVEVLRPPLGQYGPGWTGRLNAGFDERPRGGPVGAVLLAADLSDGFDLSEIAEPALSAISEVMLEKTAELAVTASNATEIPGAVLYDGDPYWVSYAAELPEDLETLNSRVKAAAETARSLPSAVSATRFRHRNSIYVLALFSHGGHEASLLTKTKLVRPGVLGKARTFDAAQYLVD